MSCIFFSTKLPRWVGCAARTGYLFAINGARGAPYSDIRYQPPPIACTISTRSRGCSSRCGH
ncbi:MAG: hypothetical protein ABI476_09680, partial [Oxalobacteraceae bacterium]